MALTYGNRCGHLRFAPVLEIPKPICVGLGGHPRILAKAAERLEAYYDNPAMLPSLGVLNPRSRAKRSERREASIRFLKAILKFLDLPTLQVATRPSPGGPLSNLQVRRLAAEAGLEMRRGERAMQDLGLSGILTVIEQRTVTRDGEFRSESAIKRVSKHFFGALGLELELKLEREKAIKRIKRWAPEGRTFPRKKNSLSEESARERLMVEAIRNLVGTIKPRSRVSSELPMCSHERDPERQRRWNEEAIMLRTRYPDWPAEAIRAAADKVVRN